MRVNVECPYEDCLNSFSVEVELDEVREESVGKGEIDGWNECPKCDRWTYVEVSVSLDAEAYEESEEEE